MSRPTLAILACLVALAVTAAGCGSGAYNGIKVPKNAGHAVNCEAVRKVVGQLYCGAALFSEHCSGCHTIDAANTRGSRPNGNVNVSERTNGPNFNVRREVPNDVLFAIRNGGFSGAIMPANVVVGQNAQDVAAFLARYAGSKAPKTTTANSTK